MANAFIQVAPDSTGKQLQTFQNTVSGQSVHAEAMVAVDPAGLPVIPSTATRSSVNAAAVDTLLLAANTLRRGATFTNNSSATLYLALGTAAASTSSYTVKLVTDAYYELPVGFQGQVRGIWASATGNVQITELT